MERLTERRNRSGIDINLALERLAAYENTGLEPEEVLTGEELAEIACAITLLKEYQSLGWIDHLRELAHAEKDGRLIVLPKESP